jgi:hypothetical protein
MQRKGRVQRLTNRAVKHGCCKRPGCVRRTYLTRPLDYCDRCMRDLIAWQAFLVWLWPPEEVEEAA